MPDSARRSVRRRRLRAGSILGLLALLRVAPPLAMSPTACWAPSGPPRGQPAMSQASWAASQRDDRGRCWRGGGLSAAAPRRDAPWRSGADLGDHPAVPCRTGRRRVPAWRFAAGGKSINGGVPEAVISPRSPALPGPSGGHNGGPRGGPSGGPRGANRGGGSAGRRCRLARGLFLLHARYGNRPFESLMSRPNSLPDPVCRSPARWSRTWRWLSGPLLADPGARAVFSPDGVPLTEGQTLRQARPRLDPGAAPRIRCWRPLPRCPGRRIEQSLPSPAARSSRRPAAALPKLVAPLWRPYASTRWLSCRRRRMAVWQRKRFDVLVEHTNEPGRGGGTVAGGCRTLPGPAGDATGRADRCDLPGSGLPPLPASTTLATLDRAGNAVVCALTRTTCSAPAGSCQPWASSPRPRPPRCRRRCLRPQWCGNDNLTSIPRRGRWIGPGRRTRGRAVALITPWRTNRAHERPVPDPRTRQRNRLRALLGRETVRRTVDPSRRRAP